MLVSEIIHDLSVDLNDQVPGYEYIRWTETQLATYINEALLQLCDLPNIRRYFTRYTVIPVEPGVVWQGACAECTQIIRILGESTSTGAVINRLRRVEDIEDNMWAGSVFGHCATANPYNYQMHSYSVSATDKSLFMVYPPVPAGQRKYVLAECYQQPDGTKLTTDVPDVLLAAVKQWALYRALAVDSENSPTITEVAERHRTTFFKLIETMLSLEALKENDDGADRSGVRGVQKQAGK